MNIYCITGSVPSQVSAIAASLYSAGLGRPTTVTAAGSGPDIADLPAWHRRLLASHEPWPPQPDQRIQPGKLWENLAADLFLANLHQPLWGWADHNSLWLLDFWHAFEPRLQFLLLATPPSRLLAETLTNDQLDADPNRLMDLWVGEQQRMLHFHLRHPQSSLLIDADAALNYPAWLIERCRQHSGFALSQPSDDPAVQCKRTNGGLEEADDPIAADLIARLSTAYPEAWNLFQDIAASWESNAPGGQNPLASLPSIESRQLVVAYRQIREHSSRLDQQLTSAKQRGQQIEDELKGNKEENELLLLQLHQLQEELEKTFLEHQKLERTSQARELALTKEVDAQQAQQQSLIHEKNGLIEKIKLLESERDQQLTSTKAHSHDIETELNEIKEENELLLLQLHQVQEELEDYFLKHQQASQQNHDADARWQRLLQRHPNLYDYTSLAIVPEDEAKTGAENPPAAIRWRIEHLVGAGQIFERIDCLTLLWNQTLALEFSPGTPNTGASDRTDAHRWPSHDAQLSNWSARDWDRLRLFTLVLSEVLAQPQIHRWPDKIAPEPWQRALNNSLQALAPAADVLRFDQVSLEREQVNPDYEHLWLSLAPVIFAEHRWPRWEFRLSCANVGPERFGSHPKLEFPAADSDNPLTSWFAEAHNDYGANLELRFAQPDAVDMGVWQQLNQTDQALITALVARLPAILDQLQHSGATITRPWNDWQRLAADIQRIHGPHGVRTAPAAAAN